MCHNALRALFIAGLLLGGSAFAQDNGNTNTNSIKMDEGYGDAFVNYKPYIKDVEKPVAPKPQTVPAPEPSKALKPEAGKQPVTVEWLRANYPKLEDRAINNPTEENVTAYLYAKRIILDKAQQFSNMVIKVNNQDPLLNENNRVPYASGGALSVRNANYLAQQQAVRELAKVGGVIVFVDGHCRFCTQEIPVIEGIKKTFGLEYLIVSIDGTAPKNYQGQVQADNGLFQKLGLKLTPSVVFVPNPKGYKAGADQNKYFIIAQGFYAQDELAKQIAYAGHDSNLLTAETMRDLNVWERGVASTDDLQALALDVNKPGTFKKTLQPILIKQYK
jgi:conjugal transfer pilus assembly protein TraF